MAAMRLQARESNVLSLLCVQIGKTQHFLHRAQAGTAFRKMYSGGMTERAYIITCTVEASQLPEYKRAFEGALESFRVLDRPARFGSILMGGIQGGLIGALGYLLHYITLPLIAFIRR